jgi:glutamate--cysteine ligase
LPDNLTRTLQKIEQAGAAASLGQSRRGLEKESLRIDPAGSISQAAHQVALGSPLTHRFITTDYSEALLEFVTPVCETTAQALAFMTGLHQFAYHNIGDEKLWVNSMPCVLHGEDSIPIARYGTSNAGRMKYVYRVGLAHRYSKLMQAISGVHFNWSLAEAFWFPWREICGSTMPLRDFRSDQYLGLVRNFYRYDWAIPYLFGASPAVCGTFLEGRSHHLEQLGHSSYYLPHATSLRLSDVGYHSKAQAQVQIGLDSLAEYLESLLQATSMPYPPYQEVGIRSNGEYQQLSTTLLQIENEYYAGIRPKRVAHSGERPIHALRERGVEYVELRYLDLNPFLPVGIDAGGSRFLELLLLLCLLKPSPPLSQDELEALSHTRTLVVEQGRRPGLLLPAGPFAQATELKARGLQLLKDMEVIADFLDQYGEGGYRAALTRQRACFEDSETTPSAQVLAAVHAHDDSFFSFALEQAEQHRQYFKSLADDPACTAQLVQEAADSLARQQVLEETDTLSFEDFLAEYFTR